MFCPLCQSEYREGFNSCSDCKIELVTSFKQAQESSVRLWSGPNQRVLDRILEKLDREGILAHYKVPLDADDPGFSWSRLLSGRFGTRYELKYEVWVLRKDVDQARAATAALISN
jgi:hypothetical protein